MTATLPISASVLAAWREDELASWEDAGAPAAGHPYVILGRRRTRLVIEGAEELDALRASAAHHAAAWDDRHGYRAALRRVIERLDAAAA